MNCKPGDLAVIVRADFCKENIGRIVEVVGLFDFEGGEPWHLVKAQGAPLVGCNEFGLDRQLISTGPVRDADMRPISGVPLDDEAPIETDVPEALRLALAIESRSYA